MATTNGHATNPDFHVTVLSDRSLLTKILQPLIRPFRPRLVAPGKPLPAGSPKLSPPHTKATITERQLEGIYLYDFHPPNKPRTPLKHHLYYFAGGGFQSPPSKEHWKLCSKLSTSLSPHAYQITLISYPLAPNSPATQSLPLCRTLFTTLLHYSHTTNTTITLAGDSSGANIALSLALWHAQNPSSSQTQTPTPESTPLKSLLLISPPCDLRNTNPAILTTSHHDPILTKHMIESVASAWAGTLPPSDPSISPNLADISSLKAINIRVHGVVGTYDVLAPDALVLRDLCARHGVAGRWLVWEGQMHCFPLAGVYGLPEGKSGVEWCVDVLRGEEGGG